MQYGRMDIDYKLYLFILFFSTRNLGNTYSDTYKLRIIVINIKNQNVNQQL